MEILQNMRRGYPFQKSYLLWQNLNQKISNKEINKKRGALRMVADWRLSAVYVSFLSDALSEPNEENLKKLLEKHPVQDIPENIPSPVGLEQIKIQPNLVLKMLRSFPKASPPGPTGARASHLLHAVQNLNQTSALDTLTDFLNHLVSGLVPQEVQSF